MGVGGSACLGICDEIMHAIELACDCDWRVVG